MEPAEGEGRAIGGDEEVGALEIRRQGRDEVELDGPLAEAGLPGRDRAGPIPVGGVAGDVASQAAGASA